jgi:hypothetical protein
LLYLNKEGLLNLSKKKTFIAKENRPEIKLDTQLADLTVKDLITIVTKPTDIKSIKQEKPEYKDIKSIKQEKSEYKVEIKDWKDKWEKERYEVEIEKADADFRAKRDLFDDRILEKMPEFIEKVSKIEVMIEKLSSEIAELKERIH